MLSKKTTKKTVNKNNQVLIDELKSLGFDSSIEQLNKTQLNSLKTKFDKGEIVNDDTVHRVQSILNSKACGWAESLSLQNSLRKAYDSPQSFEKCDVLNNLLADTDFSEEQKNTLRFVHPQLLLSEVEIGGARLIILANMLSEDEKYKDLKIVSDHIEGQSLIIKLFPSKPTNVNMIRFTNALNTLTGELQIIVADNLEVERTHTELCRFVIENESKILEA